MADRQRHDTCPRRSKVVMTMHETKFEPEHKTVARSTEEIAELFDVIRGEAETIRQLSGCVENFHTVQAAKRALLGVTPAEVRAALEHRRLVSSESS